MLNTYHVGGFLLDVRLGGEQSSCLNCPLLGSFTESKKKVNFRHVPTLPFGLITPGPLGGPPGRSILPSWTLPVHLPSCKVGFGEKAMAMVEFHLPAQRRVLRGKNCLCRSPAALSSSQPGPGFWGSIATATCFFKEPGEGVG